MLEKLLRFTKLWIKQKNKREVKVLLDTDFHYVFKPFYYISKIFSACTYNVHQNYASPVTKINILLSLITNCLLLIFFFVALQIVVAEDENAKFSYITLYVQYVVIFSTVSFVTYYYSEENFALLVKLQVISRYIKNPEDMIKIKTKTRIAIWMEIFAYILITAVRITNDGSWHWTKICLLITTIMFEMKLLQVSFILQFLVCKLRKWCRNVIQIYKNDESTSQMLNELHSVFQTIMQIFQLIKTVFQVIVSWSDLN